MARKLVKAKTQSPMAQLEILVPEFAETKATADEYKKSADEQNKRIKAVIKEISDDSQTLEIAGYKVDFQKQERTSMNEEKVLESFGKCKKIQFAKDMGIIKTKEYIDYDALENAIYNGRISEKLLALLKDCEEVKIVEVLKVSKKKEK
jgi:hypothetical protein